MIVVRFIAIILLLQMSSFAQVDQILKSREAPNRLVAYYDCSDRLSENMKIAVWGAVRFPGYYLVPKHLSVQSLLSYAGGLSENAQLESIRVIRKGSDSLQQVINIDFEDYFKKKSVTAQEKDIPLMDGDVLVVPQEDRFFTRDYLTIGVNILSVIGIIVNIILSRRNW